MKDFVLGLLGISLAGAVYFLLPNSCPEAARRTAFALVIAATFWSLEILPLYVTSLCVVLILAYTLGKPDGVLDLGKTGYKIFLIPFSSPVIMLFFGGFMLASAMHKHRVDSWIAHSLLSTFGTRPLFLLFGVLVTTGFLSMWISNTVATALVVGIFQSNLSKMYTKEFFTKALILAIPFGANIGGIATPIGSPPNAIAIGLLNDFQIDLNFFEWMGICLPLMLLLIFIAAIVLYLIFRPTSNRIHLLEQAPLPLNSHGRYVLTIVCLTIIMFLSSPLHGIPESLIALTSTTCLLVFRMLDINDLRSIRWEILILMWGGLALGVAVETSGLGQWIANTFLLSQEQWLLILAFSLMAFFFSMFISNTATVALLLPIALEIPNVDKIMLAIVITLVSNLAMMFPVSTPPNAIAYATGLIRSRDMIFAGSVINIIAFLFIIGGYRYIIPLMVNY